MRASWTNNQAQCGRLGATSAVSGRRGGYNTISASNKISSDAPMATRIYKDASSLCRHRDARVVPRARRGSSPRPGRPPR
eukprot:scaffold31609_cov90-Isochrysis_galbana.AAC.3